MFGRVPACSGVRPYASGGLSARGGGAGGGGGSVAGPRVVRLPLWVHGGVKHHPSQ